MDRKRENRKKRQAGTAPNGSGRSLTDNCPLFGGFLVKLKLEEKK
jgi:hypothetical protein